MGELTLACLLADAPDFDQIGQTLKYKAFGDAED